MQTKHYRNIRIQEETYQKLLKIGTFSDTFNSIIERLLERSESTLGTSKELVV
jgi:predicted CopG family antitoxin